MNQDNRVGYKKLNVYHEAHDLVLLVYKCSATFPAEEKFGLTSQLRRAVVSVVANIVEGQVRTNKEFINFLRIANGSLVEVEYFIELSRDLGYLGDAKYQELDQKRAKVGAMLNHLIHSKMIKHSAT